MLRKAIALGRRVPLIQRIVIALVTFEPLRLLKVIALTDSQQRQRVTQLHFEVTLPTSGILQKLQ